MQGEPWTSAIAGHDINPLQAESETKRLLLERFQEEVSPCSSCIHAFAGPLLCVHTRWFLVHAEYVTKLLKVALLVQHPGFDFSGAEFNGQAPNPRHFMGGMMS